MSNYTTTKKKFIIYDHKMECLKEVVIRQEEKISKELENILDRSVLFLEYGDTYYYRDVNFLQEN